jgi:tRNA A-37 threonylcarbamoyl transferase component Bud32
VKKYIDISKLTVKDRGAYSAYYILNKTDGLKVMQCKGYPSIKKLKSSVMWRNTTKESTLLKKANKRGDFFPKFIKTVPVKFGRVYYPAIVMQHIKGIKAFDYYKSVQDRNYVLDRMTGELMDIGIHHEDLHGDNVIVCRKTLKHYVIDFTPEFVSMYD